MLTMLYERSTCSPYLEDLVLLATKKQLSWIWSRNYVLTQTLVIE